MPNRTIQQEIFSPCGDALSTLAAAFPEAVKDGEVDWEALKAIFNDTPYAGPEKYELTWAGKEEAKREAGRDVVGRTLRFCPEESKDAEATQNLYIEGDNLEVLKLLRENYYGAVKMIYIDPPYNIDGDFVYRDNYTQTSDESDIAEGNIAPDGERLIKNSKSSNRFHATWLSMMYPRLRVARDLLSTDGVIVISIDEKEHANLRKLSDEIFGELNFAGEIVWKNSSKNDQAYISMQHEYFLFYVKSKDINLGDWSEKKEGLDEIFKAFDGFRQKHGDNWKSIHEDALKFYAQFNEANPIYASKHYSWMDTRGVYFPSDISGPNFGQYRYDVIHPITGKKCKEPASGWRYPEETMKQRIEEHLVHFGDDETTIPNNKTYLADTQNQSLTSIKYRDGRAASKSLTSLMGINCFSNPKDVDLLNIIMSSVGLKEGDIILDFFSGSGSIAEAVMKYNADKQLQCRFILVQVQEDLRKTLENATGNAKTIIKNAIKLLEDLKCPPFITEIGKERIRRSGEKIYNELHFMHPGGELFQRKEVPLDIGFKSFKTADTVIRWTNDALRSGEQLTLDEAAMSDKDRLDFMPGFTDIDVVYEIALRQNDVPLSAPVRLVPGAGKRTYLFADSILVCLEEAVTPELVEALAAIQPTPNKFVLRDSAFEDDIVLKDETLRRLQACVARNTKDAKTGYVVDFI